MLVIVQHRVKGLNILGRKPNVLPRVEIPVKTGEIAARNLQPQRMAVKKKIAGRPKIERNLVNLSRVHQRRAFA